MADASAGTVNVVIEAVDRTKIGITSATSNLEGLGSRMKDFGLGAKLSFAAAGAAIIGFTKQSISEFAEAELSIKRVEFAYGEASRAIIHESQRLQQSSFATDEQIQQAFLRTQNAVAKAGGTISQQMALVRGSMETGARTGQDFEDVLSAVNLALQTGSSRGLAKFGLSLKDTADSGEQLNDIIKQLEKNTGALDETMNTTAGRINLMSKNWGELKESFGGFVAPAANRVFESLNLGFKELQGTLTSEDYARALEMMGERTLLNASRYDFFVDAMNRAKLAELELVEADKALGESGVNAGAGMDDLTQSLAAQEKQIAKNISKASRYMQILSRRKGGLSEGEARFIRDNPEASGEFFLASLKEDNARKDEAEGLTARGGIVNSPQTRVVGEAGPEAIIPLDRMNSVGKTIVVQEMSFNIYGQTNASEFARQVQRELATLGGF